MSVKIVHFIKLLRGNIPSKLRVESDIIGVLDRFVDQGQPIVEILNCDLHWIRECVGND